MPKHDGANNCFCEGGGGGLKYFAPDLVDSFVENKNSDIEVICSDLYIFCHNESVQDKG